MKKDSLIGLIVFSGAMAANAQGPVGHWSFDSGIPGFSATDSGSGNHRLVALHKPELLVSIPGVSGRAIQFADTGFEFEAAGTRDTFNFPRLTVEAVVSVPAADAFIAQYNIYGHDQGVSLAKGWAFFFNVNRQLEFATGNQSLYPIWQECASAQIMVPGTVHHVAGVLDDAGFDKVYVDGEEAMAIPTRPYLRNDTQRMRVGYGFGNGVLSGYMKPGSAMDELKLWDRALPAGEIRSHYLAVKDAIDKLNRASPGKP